MEWFQLVLGCGVVLRVECKREENEERSASANQFSKHGGNYNVPGISFGRIRSNALLLNYDR